MAFVELYIEDELIDLDDAEIQTDYAIAEIGNFATRNSFRSVDFDIPKTANNKRILENSDIVNNLTTRPYRRLKARLAVDGIDQLIRFADIEQTSDSYNIRLYGGNASFFDLVKNLNLSDLDLSEFDHYINLTNIVNSRTNTDGYIYPLIDYHTDSPNVRIDDASNVFRVNYTFPSVFLETILNKAVVELGYILINNLPLSPDYQKGELIIPCVTPVRNSDFEKYKQRFEKLLVPPFNEVPSGLSPLPAGIFQIIAPQSNFYNVGSIEFVEFADAVEYTATYNIQINNSGVATPITFLTFDTVVENNSPVPTNIFTATVNPGANTFTGTFTRTALTSPNGATSSLLFVDNSNPNLTYTSAEIIITGGRVIEPNEIIFGDPFKRNYVTVNSLFGKLKVSDVFKAYLQKFCGLIQVNEFTKVVQLDYFDTVGKNIGLAIDWSEKIDYSETETLEFELDKYAQTNNFTYKDDNDVDKPIGTDGVINIDDQTLDADADIVELVYSATEMAIRLEGLQLPNIGLFETTDGSPPVTELRGKANPRILLLERVAGDVDYTDGISTTTVTTNLPLAWFIRLDKDYNLGFENNLIPLFYGTLQTVLNRAKIVTENVRLTPLDIQQLDFLKPVFIDKHNSYFYISKISGFNPATTEATEVELIKLR